MRVRRSPYCLSSPGPSGTSAAWKAIYAATNPDARAALVDVANRLTMPVSWQIDTLASMRQQVQALGNG